RHRDLVAPDHEVDVDRALVDPVAILVTDGRRVGAAERDVAGRVLVEERVEEHAAGLADPAFPVDERDLAEAVGVLVAADARAERFDALVGVDRDGPAALAAAPGGLDPCAGNGGGLRGW